MPNSIKRLFYLSFRVKLQFFKSFVMPFFDYCSSLLIYWSFGAINKIFKLYNSCIKRLFKLSLSELSIEQIDIVLEPFNLRSLHSRYFFKFLVTAGSIFLKSFSPVELRSELAHAPPDPYFFRESTVEIFLVSRSQSDSGDLTFSSFYTKLFNTFKLDILSPNS